MKTRLAILMALFSGFLSAQVEMNYSYEMKYGDGKQVERTASDNPVTSDYSYFENLLDINTYFGDHIYLYTQLEYSNPPVFGYSRTRIDSMINRFYLEYSHEKFNVKLGDLYELFGRGLSFYTMQDQTIDHDNSIRGLALNYSLKENLEISTLVGTGEYAYRSKPTYRKSDYQINNNVILGSIDYETGPLGSMQFICLNKTTFLIYNFIKDLRGDGSNIGEELADRTSIIDFLSSTGNNDTLYQQNINLNWNLYIGPIEVYLDKSWIQYDKIYGDEVFGSRFYTSVYTEFFDAGITYEYKNYYSPHLIKSISNPPIVYREGNSILASRNVHSMNFGNEIGHQIDLNRNLFVNMNLAANLSLAHRHKSGDMASISYSDVLSMKDEDEMYDYYPFRQVYLAMNGWALSERLYYQVGMDHFTEFYGGKNTSALTFPTHWVWKLSSGSSFTIYMEAQEKIEKQRDLSDFTLDKEAKYLNYYSSLSYNHMGKWVVTSFYDQETKNSTSNKWMGADLSYKISSETQISIFYGSQKGGLVCANGICAEQPGFEDGYKITLRSLF